jgi:hypothetical protein
MAEGKMNFDIFCKIASCIGKTAFLVAYKSEKCIIYQKMKKIEKVEDGTAWPTPMPPLAYHSYTEGHGSAEAC